MSLKKDGNKVPIHIDIDSEDYKLLKDRSKKEKMSACSLVRKIMNDYIDSYGELNE